MFYLVFGESVVNDAVGLVLFYTCSKIVMNDEDVSKATRRPPRRRESRSDA